MKQRINVYEKGMRAMKTLYGLSLSTANSTVEPAVFGLIYNRVSQINGCAYCLAGDAESVKAKGETAQRIFLLNAWRETALYSDRERAALAWAEALTNLKDGVPDEVYAEASANFSDEELVDLTMSVITINAYNSVNVPFRVEAGAHEAAFAAPQEK
jgi:AhpD family alkylhydroperoxidase